MAEPLPVQFSVLSDSGNSHQIEKNASLSIVARDKVGDATWPYEKLPLTHKYFQNGFYRALSGKPADEPGAGEWLLVARLGGKSPVVQRITLSVKGAVLVADAGWGVPASKQLQNTALTVSIVNYEQKQGAAPPRLPRQTRISAKLLPRQEVVGLACVDRTGSSLGGTHFEEFAKSRRDRLFADEEVNDGVIATILDAKTRMTQIWVKSRAPRAVDWLLLEERQKAPPPLSVKTPVVGKDLSIVDFYQHLSDVGRVAPGSVIEAGIFGHAYVLGPIVWNTFDRVPSFTKRDPNDFDGRSKDWVPRGAVDTTFRTLHDAFHPTKGALRAWGCNHMNNVLAEISTAMNAMRMNVPRDQFFMVTLPPLRDEDQKLISKVGHENVTLDHLKRSVAQYIVSQKIKHTIEHGDATGVVAYCGAAMQKLHLRVIGAPPGIGSSFKKEGGEWIMFIDPRAANQEKKIGSLAGLVGARAAHRGAGRAGGRLWARDRAWGRRAA